MFIWQLSFTVRGEKLYIEKAIKSIKTDEFGNLTISYNNIKKENSNAK